MEITTPNRKNICKTCGTRYAEEKFNPEECPVCLDDRQYVNPAGQRWVSYEELQKKYSIKFSRIREDIYELSVMPSFGIGQKAHLILSEEGNILWDCLPFLDEPASAFIKSLGGLKAIAISHPHYYGIMHEWAREFDCPVYLHENDREWVMDKEKHLNFWKGEGLKLSRELKILCVGGHFPGSTVLHFTPENQHPALFIGDSFYLSLSKKHLSAMYSYPNNIPLKKKELFRTFGKIEPLDFDALFGAFAWQNLYEGGREVFRHSLERYREIYGA